MSPVTPSAPRPDTTRALVQFWHRHFPELARVSQDRYRELDALIRADERHRVAKALGATLVEAWYTEAAAPREEERQALAAAPHVGCPMCADHEPTPLFAEPRAWKYWVYVGAAVVLGTLVVLWLERGALT